MNHSSLCVFVHFICPCSLTLWQVLFLASTKIYRPCRLSLSLSATFSCLHWHLLTKKRLGFHSLLQSPWRQWGVGWFRSGNSSHHSHVMRLSFGLDIGAVGFSTDSSVVWRGHTPCRWWRDIIHSLPFQDLYNIFYLLVKSKNSISLLSSYSKNSLSVQTVLDKVMNELSKSK